MRVVGLVSFRVVSTFSMPNGFPKGQAKLDWFALGMDGRSGHNVLRINDCQRMAKFQIVFLENKRLSALQPAFQVINSIIKSCLRKKKLSTNNIQVPIVLHST
jgi:hypothetical protein